MASLAPCSSCRRHLRRHEAQCPFCAAQQPPRASAPQQTTTPSGASRATLLALGLALVACGGRTGDDPVQNGSGASTGDGSGGSQGTGNAGRGGAGGEGVQDTCTTNPLLANCTHGVPRSRCDDNPLLPECSPVPPYGAMPYPLPGTAGAAGSGGTMNPGSLDAGAEDAGGGDAAPDEDAGN